MKNKSFTSLIFLVIFTVALFFIAFPVKVSALTVNSIYLQDSINEDMSFNEVFVINLSNNVDDFFKFSLPIDAQDVKINNVPQKIDNTSLSIPLNCTDCVLKIEYLLRDKIKTDSGDMYLFSRTLDFPIIPANMNYSVKLPIGYIIKAKSGEPSIVPSPSGLSTDGTQIIVSWEQNSPSLPARYYISYSGHEDTEALDQEFRGEFSEWPVIVLCLLFFILGAAGGFFAQRYFVKTKMSDLDKYSPASLLSADEKVILELLKKNHNKMGQKEIGKELGWSKSKVSAIMTNLEYKKVVSREKVGRNYTVVVEKKLL